MFFADDVNDCFSFNGTGFEGVISPQFDYLLGAMTHWNENPIIMGGNGFEVETYDGSTWNQLENLPNPGSWSFKDFQYFKS